MAKLATENLFNGKSTEISNENELFNENEMLIDEYENNNEKLPITLFQEIETELLDKLLNTKGSESDDEIDGPIEGGERKTFLNILTKIFPTLLSVKADNIEKIIKV